MIIYHSIFRPSIYSTVHLKLAGNSPGIFTWIHHKRILHGEFPLGNLILCPRQIGEFTKNARGIRFTVNSPWWIHRGEFSIGILWGIPDGEFPIGNTPWWIPHGEFFLGNRIHSREFIWFILENLGMQHQNAAIYVCMEANCQLKTDTEGHRGLCRYQDVMMACCHIVTVIFLYIIVRGCHCAI